MKNLPVFLVFFTTFEFLADLLAIFIFTSASVIFIGDEVREVHGMSIFRVPMIPAETSIPSSKCSNSRIARCKHKIQSFPWGKIRLNLAQLLTRFTDLHVVQTDLSSPEREFEPSLQITDIFSSEAENYLG